MLVACGGKAGPVQIDRIAFGGASRQNSDQSIWKQIASNNPDIWIWVGDCIYAPQGTVEEIQQAYAIQRQVPSYRDFIHQTRVLGTWNVHEYGQRPSRWDNPIRATAQKLYLDFLGEPQLSKRRGAEGIYASYDFGSPGRNIKVILLDTRSFNRGPGSSEPLPLLGARQWAWLETELSRADAQFIFIVSSIPVIPTQIDAEKWADYGNEREALLMLLGNTRAFGVVLLSGGRYLGEMSSVNTKFVQYSIHEFTSSGLTYFDYEYSGDFDKTRISDVFIGNHFGLVTIDWEQNPPNVQVEIRDEKNKVSLDVTQRRSKMQPRDGKRAQRERVDSLLDLGAD